MKPQKKSKTRWSSYRSRRNPLPQPLTRPMVLVLVVSSGRSRHRGSHCRRSDRSPSRSLGFVSILGGYDDDFVGQAATLLFCPPRECWDTANAGPVSRHRFQS